MRLLIELVLGCGPRMSESLELDWRDVDLQGARAMFWRTKGGKPRRAALPPGLVATLANLPYRDGENDPPTGWRTLCRPRAAGRRPDEDRVAADQGAGRHRPAGLTPA